MIAASLLAAALLIWAGITLAMLYNQASVSMDRQLLDARQRSVASEARTVNAYKRSVGDIAQDLDRRQDMLDDLIRSQFGAKGSEAPLEKAVIGKHDAANKTSSALPALQKLRALEARQVAFARNLSGLIEARARKAEAAIRSFGLDPGQMVSQAGAQGGPFVPWSREASSSDQAFTALTSALARLNSLERGLAAIPSGRPTASPSLTSSYGMRRDPFNGQAAFHAGLDFPGSYGQPILAAAAGRISFVGPRQGYGNCIEVTHANGILTRYAHLSRFDSRVGQQVARGAQIGRMGSTGRSTGTHLHFEVRVDGNPINPRRFLEANPDVLQVQQIAKQRVSDVAG